MTDIHPLHPSRLLQPMEDGCVYGTRLAHEDAHMTVLTWPNKIFQHVHTFLSAKEARDCAKALNSNQPYKLSGTQKASPAGSTSTDAVQEDEMSENVTTETKPKAAKAAKTAGAKAGAKAPAKKAATKKTSAKKAKPAKKAAAEPAEPVERAPRRDLAEVVVQLNRKPKDDDGCAKRDIVITEILEKNGRKMALNKLLSALDKALNIERPVESVWANHGRPSGILRTAGIITVK